jgi:hypothetical protein
MRQRIPWCLGRLLDRGYFSRVPSSVIRFSTNPLFEPRHGAHAGTGWIKGQAGMVLHLRRIAGNVEGRWCAARVTM